MPRRWSTIIAILAVEAFVLLVRTVWDLHLRGSGYDAEMAKDLSYLLVPPLLVLLLAPVLCERRRELTRLLDPRRTEARVVLYGFAIGALSRLAWWCTVVLRGVAHAGGAAGSGPIEVSWACPASSAVLLAALVWICLVPFVEETLGRGVIQSLLEYHGRTFAIAGSAIVFAAYHPPGAMPAALLMGVVFALLRANSGSLWPAIAAHAAYDGLTILDWRCLHAQWSPEAGQARPVLLAATALLGFAVCAVAIARLAVRAKPGPPPATRAAVTSKRFGHPLDDV